MRSFDELKALRNADIRILDRLGDWKPLERERGLLVIHAPWSGPSCRQMKNLTELLQQRPASHFLIYVVSSDSLSDEAVAELPRLPQGYGEIIPFAEGRFVDQIDSRDIADLDQLFDFIRDFGT